MKGKLLALILAMALGLTACGGGDAASQDDAAEEQPDAVQIEEPEVQTANYTVVESQPYSEGMAWVVYRDEDGTTYTGAMDKEGKVRFCIQGEAVATTPFEDGQAYIETEDGLLLVDEDGLVYDFSSHMADGLRAYGGGYVAAPEADMQDGLLDLVLIRKIGRLAVARVIGDYKKGAHIQNGQVAPSFQKIALFRRVRSVQVEVLDGRPIVVTEDGECEERMGVSARVCPLAARIILPAGD